MTLREHWLSVALPAGVGKTTVLLETCRKYAADRRRVIFVAHREELVDQFRSRLERGS